MENNEVPISAKTARQLAGDHPKRLQQVALFNRTIQEAIASNLREVNLHFDDYGYTYDDVKWIKELGYELDRNSACLWWTCTWSAE